MALKKFKTKEEIPAEQQADVIALLDGSFAIVEPDDTSGLQSALEAEKTRREAAEKLAKKTADDLKVLEKKQKAESHGLTAEQLDKIRAEASKDLEDKLAAKDAELVAERTANRKKDIAIAFKTLAGEHKFLAVKLDDLFRLHGDEFDLTDDGKGLIVKGKAGFDPKKHMEALAKLRPEWVEGTKAAGGGGGGTSTGTGLTSGMSVDDAMKNPSALFAAANT